MSTECEIVRARYRVMYDYMAIVRICFNGANIKKQKNKVLAFSLKQITYKFYGRHHGKVIYNTLYAPSFKNERYRKKWVASQLKEMRNNTVSYVDKYNSIYTAINEFRIARGFLPLDFKRGLAAYKQQISILHELREMYCMGADTDTPPAMFRSLIEDEYERYCEFIRYVSYIFYGYDDALKYLATIRYLKTIYSEPAVRKEIETAEELLVFGTDEEKRKFLFERNVEIYENKSFPAWPDNYLNSYIVKLLDKSYHYNLDGCLYIRYLTGMV